MTGGALLTIEAAAAELCVHPGSLRRWCACGRCPFVKLGRAVRIRKIDLERLIAASLHPAHPDLALPGVAPDDDNDGDGGEQ
jgi:excisionase family DNA binding protein